MPVDKPRPRQYSDFSLPERALRPLQTASPASIVQKMIAYLIGVDGGGSGTRVRLARADGSALSQGQAGPSGLMYGATAAWAAVSAALAQAFAAAALPLPALHQIALGCGLAGAHHPQWAAAFRAHDPGFAALVLESDALTTLIGAHQGRPGAIIALGTGSVGEVLAADGGRREVGGWGFPSSDEAGGAWIGLRAVNHLQQVLDGRVAPTAFATALSGVCGAARPAVQIWLGAATQSAYARLAPLVFEHAASNACALDILQQAGQQVALIAEALDASGTLPLALCGGLALPLSPYLPTALRHRLTPPHGDSACGALQLIQDHLRLN